MKTIGPRSLAGLLKGLFYLAFALGLLAFFYRLGSFGLAMKHADNLGSYTSSSIYQLPDKDLVRSEWQSENGRVHLSLRRLYGELQHRNLPRGLIAYIFFGELMLFGCYFMAIIQLVNMFEDLGAGKIFTPDSARYVRLVGLAIIAGTLIKPIWNALALWLFRADVFVPGTRTPWLWLIWESLHIGLLLGGLLLLVVAEAFRIGHQLHQEQELTV